MEHTSLQSETPDPLSMLWRQRYKVFFVGLLVLVVTGVYTATAEKAYESEAKLQVGIGRESMALDPTATIGPYVGLADTRETEIQAFEELLLSKTVISKVVEKLGVDELLGPAKWYNSGEVPWLDDVNLNPLRVYDRKAKAIRNLLRDLELDIPRNSKIITLRYEADSPQMARQVLETLVQVAVDEHLHVNRDDESYLFFEEEAGRLHNEVMKLEEDLAKEKSETGLSSPSQQRALLLEQISSYKNEIAHLSARGFALKKEIEVRVEQLANLHKMQTLEEVSGSASNPEFEMRVELFKLELREKELAAKYTDDNDQLRQVREQLKLARDTLQNQAQTRQVKQGLNEEREKYQVVMLERQAELAEGQARLQQLKADLEALRESLIDLDNKTKRINHLERELNLADSAYRKYKESLEIARIERQRREERISNIKMLQEPTFSEQPTSPKILVNFLVGALLAGFAGLGVAALAEWRRPTRATISEPRALEPRDVVAATDAARMARRETLTVHSPT